MCGTKSGYLLWQIDKLEETQLCSTYSILKAIEILIKHTYTPTRLHTHTHTYTHTHIMFKYILYCRDCIVSNHQNYIYYHSLFRVQLQNDLFNYTLGMTSYTHSNKRHNTVLIFNFCRNKLREMPGSTMRCTLTHIKLNLILCKTEILS